MPHKMRAVFLDGSEETMETNDFVDGAKALSGLVPVAVSYSLDYNDTAHGLYCRIGVHDAGKTVSIRGRSAPTPEYSRAFDVQLLDSSQVEELYEFWWDGACKLRRIGGSLVNLTRLAPTADQHVPACIAEAAEGACEVLASLFEREGLDPALDAARARELSSSVGWEWEAMKPCYEAYRSSQEPGGGDGQGGAGEPPAADPAEDGFPFADGEAVGKPALGEGDDLPAAPKAFEPSFGPQPDDDEEEDD